MQNPLPFNFPKSPLSDETYNQMVAWLQQKDTAYDWINRMERAQAITSEQATNMRKQMDDSVRKIQNIVSEFADLHRS